MYGWGEVSFLGAFGDSGTWRLFSHRNASQRPKLQLLTGAAHSWAKKGVSRAFCPQSTALHLPSLVGVLGRKHLFLISNNEL